MKKDDEKASDIGTNPFLSGINPDVPHDNDIAPGSGDSGDFIEVVNRLSQSAIETLQSESLPCLPSNYRLYFEKFLQKEPANVREKIRTIMRMQSDLENRALVFEKSVGESLRIIKQVLNCMSVVYQNFIIAQNVVKQYSKDMEQADNKLTLRNVMDFFIRDMNKVTKITSKQLDQIRDLYAKTDKNLKQISQNSVYDLSLDVYNRSYFTAVLQKEQQLCMEFNHSSILIYTTLSQAVTREVGQDSPVFAILLKTMAKFLQKHVQTSDFIAYMGDGIFGILLKYSDMLEAQELCVSLYQAAQITDVFVGDMNLQLDITTSIAKIMHERSIEESMSACLSTLKIALEEKQHCKIYQQDSIDGDSQHH
ncbi:hypothetical protein BKN38_07155 [Helicobacter sp. CLO-3]|uniref:diguanylate cyclase domain-containing protein n=1 Tax=unclassified Helicobacter TaxID=2593540 RepID=UPI000805BC1A|nr:MULTISPECIES: diguanylate cyclase [unclassified Helicobacter]OBV29654.1 hypothetical protein BA723_04510 [Helicobacter sp. CLO-3]OHU82428.1 hypothetical protein BKN38_07155 [Helicobacter sp. CLO-3]